LAEEEVEILSVPNITAQQIIESTMAIPAFVPATVCTGYITAWFTNLHNFRQRSLIERIFWSLPLSFAVSTIAAFLIGRFISLTAVVVFLLASAAVWSQRSLGRSPDSPLQRRMEHRLESSRRQSVSSGNLLDRLRRSYRSSIFSATKNSS
jgi:hypothetical protein